MRTLMIAGLAAGLIAAPVLAADPPPSGEHLVVAPYPGGAPWQTVTDKRNDFQSMVEIIPADQSVTAIKDIIVEQTFFKLKNQDPSAFIGGLLQRLSRSCASARINGPKSGTQNGYPVAYGQSYCVGAKGEDVDSFLKAIAGKDALYLVQREFHRPTTPGATAGVRSFSNEELPKLRALMEAQKTASEFTVDGVQLCPPASGDGPCPSVRPAASQAPPPAPAVAPAGAPANADADSFPPFINGTSTVKDVRKKLGNPSSENHNPDGRHIYTYNGRDGLILNFVFGADDVLIRVRAYGRRP